MKVQRINKPITNNPFVEVQYSKQELQILRSAHKIIENTMHKIDKHISMDDLCFSCDEFHRADHSLSAILEMHRKNELSFSID